MWRALDLAHETLATDIDELVESARRSILTSFSDGREPDPDWLERSARHEAEIRVTLAQAEIREHEERWQERIPKRFWDARLDQLEGPLAELRDWDGNRNVLLLGTVGAGKTHAAVALARYFHDHHGPVAFWSVPHLLQELRPDGDPHAMGRASAVPLVVLDDLGTEHRTDWASERLGLIIDQRWRECLPIIATSNLDAVALEKAIGPRMLSRLSDDAIRIVTTHPDRRRPHTAEKGAA